MVSSLEQFINSLNIPIPMLDRGPFIYYVITFLGFLDPPPPLRNHVFSTENNQKLAFSDPPSPPTSDYVIYEWSPTQHQKIRQMIK